MLEDRILIWKFKNGSREALCRIYRKYRKDLLRLATTLLNDVGDAEDTVHDVFLAFVESADKLGLKGSLRSYLMTCVANRARNRNRAKQQRKTITFDTTQVALKDTNTPEKWIIAGDELIRWSNVLAKLPFEQREVVVLHLRAGMKFKQIADLQGASISTVQARYRYGIDKLRSLLDSETKK